ncbi:ATP-dependent nuclease [Mesorhizobium muleiense]|uniref:ATP-dependent nuclease n=1 Tax=Mesorhizobium muleiense TaxID=1004279 RepID=UPI001F319E64|nr:AAA family ATPase [Mesorhizobium muleiense]MCF6112215.1 ATP-binding protein [Mesorhizobium muleiense]
MLDSITLKFTDSPDLVLPTAGITVFVGPNNAGKSLILKELEEAFNVHPFPTGLKILLDYEVAWPAKSSIEGSLKQFDSLQDSSIPEGYIALGRIHPNEGRQSQQFDKNQILQMGASASDKRWWTTQFLRWGVIRLDGRSRFNLTNDRPGGDLLGPPANVLAHLFQNGPARKKVREFVFDAFGLNLTIDPTNLGQLRIRLSTDKLPRDEQSLGQVAREFYAKALHIKDSSDGVQAFTGIIIAVTATDFHTILVDEPEAFLHPPLARKLGKHLASIAVQRKGSLMASTHSADFLMGCVQASKNVRVVRLEHSKGKSRGKMVDPQQLESMLKRPLMRSANVASALFHDGIIVTESDNDRAFYSEIYYRLSEKNGNYPSVLFVNAQNKQTIKDIIGPLRHFGVPAAAIPDVDIVKDGGQVWTDWLEVAQIPSALRPGYAVQRDQIKKCFEATGRDMKRDGGVGILGASDKQAANQLFDTLADHGVFVVRRGEVENWLPGLRIPGKKTEWTVAMLERMGSDPAGSNYVRPTTGDVWDFIRDIVSWIQNASRKGMT